MRERTLDLDTVEAMLYTPEGDVLRQRLWEETLTKLDFAGVRTILESTRT